ncbi:hypothetical protein LTR05_008740 [Lithohypha guttulata]|uniref:Uncharacterized protein n=1 Tax=Lithohypha guttulata TaxID=1690604 RepID=A0AAN7SEK7_9EURO|nr:hypothetical protein LTR05_008740 [Lithohypha guttulata]
MLTASNSWPLQKVLKDKYGKPILHDIISTLGLEDAGDFGVFQALERGREANHPSLRSQVSNLDTTTNSSSESTPHLPWKDSASSSPSAISSRVIPPACSPDLFDEGQAHDSERCDWTEKYSNPACYEEVGFDIEAYMYAVATQGLDIPGHDGIACSLDHFYEDQMDPRCINNT